MDNRRIIYDLLDQTRKPIIAFWSSKVTNLTKPQLEILRRCIRW